MKYHALVGVKVKLVVVFDVPKKLLLPSEAI